VAKILVIDDDIAILQMIVNILKKDGYEVTSFSDPKKIDILTTSNYDLILLDVMMPDIDGFTLCSKIRSITNCPILFLTAKSDEQSLVKGLSQGADDYISKPFGIMELRARITAHLRREHREKSVHLTFSDSYFNLNQKLLFVKNQQVNLTKGEYLICEYLAKNNGQIFTKEQILEEVFGFESNSNENTITTHIKNIRSKLQELNYEPIKTIWGTGYKWQD